MSPHLPILALAACLLASPAARAQVWYTRVHAPDASGIVSVVSVTANASANGLIVSCSSDGAVALAWVIPASADEITAADARRRMDGVTMTLDTGPRRQQHFTPSLEPWDKNHVAFVARGGRTALLPALHAIEAANGTIGIRIEGAAVERRGAAFSSTGSTAAMRREIEMCRLNPSP